MSVTSNPGVMKLVFLPNMRAGFFKISPRVKNLYRIYFSQSITKRIFNISNNQHGIHHKIQINDTKYITF